MNIFDVFTGADNALFSPAPIVLSSERAKYIARGLSSGLFSHSVLLQDDELLCNEIFLLACALIASDNASGMAPDVSVPDGGSMTVADTQELLSVLSMPPRMSRRIIYIKNAGRMSEIVQNKLLKTLEEVPENNQFILSGADGLLPTLYSRCMRIPPVDEFITCKDKRVCLIREVLRRNKNTDATVEYIRECLEFAGDIMDEGYIAAADETVYGLYKNAFDWFLFKKPKYLFDIPAEFTQSRESLDRVLSLILSCISDMLRLSLGMPLRLFTETREAAISSVYSGYTKNTLMSTFDIVLEAKERLRKNAPARQTMDNLYARSAVFNRL